MVDTIATTRRCRIVGQAFNIECLRYHEAILMTETDVDGARIRVRLLALFFCSLFGIGVSTLRDPRSAHTRAAVLSPAAPPRPH